MSGSFYLLSLQVLAPHYLNMPHQDRIQRQWIPKNRFRQFPQISHFPFSFRYPQEKATLLKGQWTRCPWRSRPVVFFEQELRRFMRRFQLGDRHVNP